MTATPEAGSFAKHTGLRRHMRGHSEIEGQDVDLPFVVKPRDKDGDRIGSMRYSTVSTAMLARATPRTPREVMASSVEQRFVASKLNYDLVPMPWHGCSQPASEALHISGHLRERS